MKPGTTQTAEAKRRIASEKRLSLVARVQRDALILQGCGQATREVYAERADCGTVTAYKRLRRLEDHGHAHSYLHRGSRVFVFSPPADRYAFTMTRDEERALGEKYT